MYRATSRLNQVRYPAAALLVTLILGCGTAPSTSTDGGPEESGGSQSELRIAMMPKLMGHFLLRCHGSWRPTGG